MWATFNTSSPDHWVALLLAIVSAIVLIWYFATGSHR